MLPGFVPANTLDIKQTWDKTRTKPERNDCNFKHNHPSWGVLWLEMTEMGWAGKELLLSLFKAVQFTSADTGWGILACRVEIAD